MHPPGRRPRIAARRWSVGGAFALAALLAGAVLAATSASQSDKPCTATGSNLNGGPADNVFCGTSGNDLLKGNRGDDELRGFAGNDNLQGGADSDQLFGGDGDDRLFGATETGGGDGKDVLVGGTGNDELVGGAADDRLFGEDGNDTLTGEAGNDFFVGGAGNDLLEARDGGLDGFPLGQFINHLSCGSGQDTLDMDLVDAAVYFTNAVSLVSACETINVGAVNEGPNVVIARRALRVSEDGRTAVRLRCPASLRQPPRCRGRLRVQLATRRSLRRRAPRTRYTLLPGQARTIPVRLSRADRRTFRRRGRARGVVTSVEVGEHGDKTTVQTVALRRMG
jgi:RTX calcium-binding nonapeptide repeat (4 copies)